MGLHHGVHEFVAAHDGIGRAGLDAQGATNAPVFVDHRHGEWPLDAVCLAQRQHRLAGDGGESGDAFSAAGRALVDVGLTSRHRLRISRAVGIAAARALRLRQHGIDLQGQWVHAGDVRKRGSGRLVAIRIGELQAFLAGWARLRGAAGLATGAEMALAGAAFLAAGRRATAFFAGAGERVAGRGKAAGLAPGLGWYIRMNSVSLG